jgi:hypothetical protein
LERLPEAIAQGREAETLTGLFLFLAVLMGAVEVLLSIGGVRRPELPGLRPPLFGKEGVKDYIPTSLFKEEGWIVLPPLWLKRGAGGSSGTLSKVINLFVSN